MPRTTEHHQTDGLHHRSTRLMASLKVVVSMIGSHTPKHVLTRLDAVLAYLYVARWMSDHHFRPRTLSRSRDDIIEELAKSICNDEVLYLEFGVWRGDSTRVFSKTLTHPAARLHGFDSFEGLPESWDHIGSGTFGQGNLSTRNLSVHGKIPTIPDSRVKFFKGWFEETLPNYEFVDSPVIVIFFDADLYSSTIYVLNTLKPHIKPGTILYFDEFWNRHHELKAFDEFLLASGMKFELLAVTPGIRQAVFRRVE